MSEEQQKTTLKQLADFFFSSSWYSFFTVTYLLFFLYSAIFYFDNVILAIKFVFYTLGLSTPLLSLGYLFWGTAFIIALIIPFSVSLSAIFILKSIWTQTDLQIKQKFISTIFAIIIVITIIISMDDIIRNVAKQSYLEEFAQKTNLLERI
ncbi:hypothetical protein KKC45_04115 [Patescibacteria group bacterium]|nr:hypothetical protein [Patescibacteria group bacterium]